MTAEINGFRPNQPQTNPNRGATRPKSYTSPANSSVFNNPISKAVNWYGDNIQKTGVQNVATSSIKGAKGTAASVALDSATTFYNAGMELYSGNVRGAYVQTSKGVTGIVGGILGESKAGQAGAVAGSIAGENLGEQGASLHLDVLDAAKESKSAREFAGRTSNAVIDRGTEVGRGIMHGVGNLLFGIASGGSTVAALDKAAVSVNPEYTSVVDLKTKQMDDMHAWYDRGVDNFYDFANGAWHGAKDMAKEGLYAAGVLEEPAKPVEIKVTKEDAEALIDATVKTVKTVSKTVKKAAKKVKNVIKEGVDNLKKAVMPNSNSRNASTHRTTNTVRQTSYSTRFANYRYAQVRGK